MGTYYYYLNWAEREARLLKRLHILSQMKKNNFSLSRNFTNNYYDQELLFQTISTYFPQPRTIYTKSKSVNFKDDVQKFLHPSALNCGKRGELTYYIKSHYSRGYQRRKFIRETWGKFLSVKFLVAGTVDDSMAPDFNSLDLIVLALTPESFDNISYKVGAALLHAHKCQSPMFMMDDDVLIFPERIQFPDLSDTNKDPIFVGNLLELSIPLRNPTHKNFQKYAVSNQIYPFNYYPTYANGIGYILNLSAVNKLVQSHALSKTQFLLKLDDTYFGMLAFTAQIPVTEDENFSTGRLKINDFRKDVLESQDADLDICQKYNLHLPAVIDKVIEEGRIHQFYEMLQKSVIEKCQI